MVLRTRYRAKNWSPSRFDRSCYFRKVMLDIAVPQPTGFPTAGAIEDCLCPRGYSGRSCEQCSVGHFRDESDRSRGPLGTCRPCECGGNEVSCEWDPSARGGHRCECRAGFAGERLVCVCFKFRGPFQNGHLNVKLNVNFLQQTPRLG